VFVSYCVPSRIFADVEKLAMGGISLGKAVLASGLLDDMYVTSIPPNLLSPPFRDVAIQAAVRGFDIWPILALSAVVCLVIATFVSHTVASVLLVPVAAQIGESMEIPHPRLLIMARFDRCPISTADPALGNCAYLLRVSAVIVGAQSVQPI
jgi:phosphate transporter